MGKWGLLCKMRTKWGPFQQFGPHEDQVPNCGLFWKALILADGYMWTLNTVNSPLLHCIWIWFCQNGNPNFSEMGTLASRNGDLKSVCSQNWSKWLNLLIKGDSFVCFINGGPCGYSALLLFSVHTEFSLSFSQFEITKNLQNISILDLKWRQLLKTRVENMFLKG